MSFPSWSNLRPAQESDITPSHDAFGASPIRINLIATTLTFATAGTANAAGCLKGAAVGGVAGHYAGHHAAVGAVGGCMVGRHLAKQHAQQQAVQRQATPAQ